MHKQDFSHNGSVMLADGFLLYGDIFSKWASLGGVSEPLSQATSDERPAANGGRYNNFQYGFIYWTPQTGAHAVYGIIGQKWNSLGREGGRLGYPVSDELPVGAAGGRVNNFQNGSIYWTPGQPATVVFK